MLHAQNQTKPRKKQQCDGYGQERGRGKKIHDTMEEKKKSKKKKSHFNVEHSSVPTSGIQNHHKLKEKKNKSLKMKRAEQSHVMRGREIPYVQTHAAKPPPPLSLDLSLPALE